MGTAPCQAGHGAARRLATGPRLEAPAAFADDVIFFIIFFFNVISIENLIDRAK